MEPKQEQQMRELVEETWKIAGPLPENFWDGGIVHKVDSDWQKPLVPSWELWEVLTRKDDHSVAVTNLEWDPHSRQWQRDQTGTHVINLDPVKLDKFDDYRELPGWAIAYLEERIRSRDLQAKEITRRTLEEIMQDSSIDQRGVQFGREARRLADLIVEGSTVTQALNTVEDGRLSEELRTFMYAVLLRMCVIVAHGLGGGLTDEQAADLHEYLKDLVTV
jgi:hypothetical protein